LSVQYISLIFSTNQEEMPYLGKVILLESNISILLWITTINPMVLNLFVITVNFAPYALRYALCSFSY
jgi:hypothetical protein